MVGEQLALALSDENLKTLGIVGMAMAVGIVAIVMGAVKCVLRTREKERTKREVAAYVAEGTIAPEDAQRILSGSNNDFEVKIGKAVSCGIISSGKAERLIKAIRDEWRRSDG